MVVSVVPQHVNSIIRLFPVKEESDGKSLGLPQYSSQSELLLGVVIEVRLGSFFTRSLTVRPATLFEVVNSNVVEPELMVTFCRLVLLKSIS